MAHVYKAEDTKLKRTIALKFISPQKLESEETRTRFIQEAQTAAGLNHPNINTIYEINEIEDKTFIAMEYIEGTTLRDIIGTSPQNIGKSFDIACQMAEGLQEAHENGVVHRDIKSSNIMVTSKGQVKIMDFGLVKLEGATKITKTTMVMGTVSYMSPEQAAGDDIDFRSDIWSFGVVLYEMLTGRLPFQGTNDQVTLYAIQHKKHEPVSTYRSNLPYQLENIVDRCLKKKPKDRYQSVANLRLDLERIKQDITSDHATISMPVTSILRMIRRPFLKKTVSISIVIFALLAVIVFTPVSQILKDWLSPQSQNEKQGLAVIPFTITNGIPDDSAYCAGLMDFLIGKLAKIFQTDESYWVVPSLDVKEINNSVDARKAFSVDFVLGITMHVIGEEIRFHINLIDIGTEIPRQIDTAIFHYNAHNRLGLEDELVKHSISILGVDLPPQALFTLSEKPTENQEASIYYLQARGSLLRYDKIESLNKAVNLFDQAIQKDPRYALAYAGLGEAYWRRWILTKENDDVQKAQEYCLMAVQIDKNLAPVHITLGIIHRGTGKYLESKNNFNSALALDPQSDKAYRELGSLHQELGDTDNAEKQYLKAIDLVPNYWGGYNQLGSFYYATGKFDLAIKMFKKVTELTPDNYRGYYNLGGIYLVLGYYNRAKHTLKKSIKIQANGPAYSNLATFYFSKKKYKKAVRTYEEALKFNKNRYEFWGNLADSRRYSEENTQAQFGPDYQKAKDLAQEVLKINSKNNVAKAHIAYYNAVLGERDNAISMIEDVLLSDPKDTETLRKAVQIFEITRERDKALKAFEKYLENDGVLHYIIDDPDLKDICKDPRFKSIKKENLKNNKIFP